MARRLGATEEMLQGVQTDGATGLEQFEPAWRTAFVFADAMNQSGHAVTDEIYGPLAAHWDQGQIVEIAAVVGLFAYFNRFNDALRVEITR